MLECEIGIRLKLYEAAKVARMAKEYAEKLDRDGRPFYAADEFVEKIGEIFDGARARLLRGEEERQ